MESVNQNLNGKNLIAQSLEYAKAEANQNYIKHHVPEHARLRLQLKRSDGSTSVPYPSFDFYQIYGHKSPEGKELWFIDEQMGFSKLVKLINDKWVESLEWRTASIFMNVTTDIRHHTIVNGRYKMRKTYNHPIVNYTRGRNPWTHPAIKFNERVLHEYENITERFFDLKYFMQHERDAQISRAEASENRIEWGSGKQLADYSKLRSLPPNELNRSK